MRTSITRVVVLLWIAALAQAGTAVAQCLTKPAKVDAALNGKDAFAFAKAEAAKWNADSILTKMTTTSEGPLDAEGRSSDWSIQFFSPAAQKLNMMSFTKGVMTCYPIDRTGGGRPILVSDKTLLDTKQMLGIAQQDGGSAIDPKTVTVSAGIVQNPRSGTIWQLDYSSKETRKSVLQIMIDSTTGKVVFKDPK